MVSHEILRRSAGSVLLACVALMATACHSAGSTEEPATVSQPVETTYSSPDLPAADDSTTATEEQPSAPAAQSRSFERGDEFDDSCYNAAPFAPTYTSNSIQMTMSCRHVPQSTFFLTQVVYGDPNLQVTPSTGYLHVTGTVLGTARSASGYSVLQVQAESVTVGG